MFFQLPRLAVLFVLLLPLLLGYIVAQRRRRKFALRYASVELVRASKRGRGWRRHIPPFLFLAMFAALIFGLMKPAILVREPSDEGIVIVTLDVSASMWATDMYPSRMEAAKQAAQVFVNELPEKMRIGVVSFSETSYLNQVPTTNRSQVAKAIKKLEPRSGTAIGNGLITSFDAVYGAMGSELPQVDKGIYAPAVIVLLTDGENTDGPPPLEVVDQAITHGIRVYTIGVGSPESVTIKRGNAAIQARLDEDTLKQIAQMTDAKYYNAATEKDLRAVYQNLTTQLVTRIQPHDISFMFIALGFFLGVVALAFSLLWSNRLP
ncbi:MAG: VWA domain-containing protein [Chloroflexi bacterium]|nr:VWA domain-containing protein [Chloroflexota bacterium]